MRYIDTLVDFVSQQTSNTESQSSIYYSTIDLFYSYSQLNLHCNAAEH